MQVNRKIKKETVQQGSKALGMDKPQPYSNSYKGIQALEDENNIKLHYSNQSKYIPAANESRTAK